ncbi:MAG: RNA polymerase sigma factor [bacterium]
MNLNILSCRDIRKGEFKFFLGAHTTFQPFLSLINMSPIAKYSAAWEDRRLVGRFLKRREEGVFREIYRRHSGRLYQLSLRLMGGDEHAAEEILQEAWVRAIERLHEFRWQSSLRTWLSAIVINCSRELYRRRSAQQNAFAADELELPVLPRDHAREVDLEHAIAALPPGYRQVLVLHDIEGYRHEEISQMLAIDAGTSKSQLFRARRALRRALQMDVIKNA